MGRTVKRGRSKGRRVSDKSDSSEAVGIWGPLPAARYSMGTRAIIWIGALIAMVLIMLAMGFY